MQKIYLKKHIQQPNWFYFESSNNPILFLILTTKLIIIVSSLLATGQKDVRTKLAVRMRQAVTELPRRQSRDVRPSR